MRKLIKALSHVSFTASFILSIYWLVSTSPNFPIQGSPSGWWWFGCLLLGIFFAKLDD